MDTDTELSPETVGEMLAQAFHRGFEAGKKVGADAMRQAAKDHCLHRGKTKAVFGHMDTVAEEIAAINLPLDTVKL